jgi:hypothetical protein
MVTLVKESNPFITMAEEAFAKTANDKLAATFELAENSYTYYCFGDLIIAKESIVPEDLISAIENKKPMFFSMRRIAPKQLGWVIRSQKREVKMFKLGNRFFIFN